MKVIRPCFTYLILLIIALPSRADQELVKEHVPRHKGRGHKLQPRSSWSQHKAMIAAKQQKSIARDSLQVNVDNLAKRNDSKDPTQRQASAQKGDISEHEKKIAYPRKSVIKDPYHMSSSLQTKMGTMQTKKLEARIDLPRLPSDSIVEDGSGVMTAQSGTAEVDEAFLQNDQKEIQDADNQQVENVNYGMAMSGISSHKEAQQPLSHDTGITQDVTNRKFKVKTGTTHQDHAASGNENLKVAQVHERLAVGEEKAVASDVKKMQDPEDEPFPDRSTSLHEDYIMVGDLQALLTAKIRTPQMGQWCGELRDALQQANVPERAKTELETLIQEADEETKDVQKALKINKNQPLILKALIKLKADAVPSLPALLTEVPKSQIDTKEWYTWCEQMAASLKTDTMKTLFNNHGMTTEDVAKGINPIRGHLQTWTRLDDSGGDANESIRGARKSVQDFQKAILTLLFADIAKNGWKS
eukprot:gnl/MRDRNA2_/MRDRNA2_81886_c0_seq1.p1 gnl/MRDRNA2_/MRDRNA2_81886_c0~~gnl/MRDRNA2_/MRDRNA2_81886_c0_seq1.p1  ORF type:complete len:472 (+),score=87.06 gnl/MRDRNA2_/MRDRNA2_81886_c0_seq1:114-1529(+)